ncbi:MAG: hypothetical protein U1B78_05790 [Dehalococcoidia bacterium]|nr:hypothetical protein [Dehalococcoidia bacterium]
MSAISLALFVIALLLAIGAIEPTGPWLVALAVLAGVQFFRIRPFGRVWGRRRRRAGAGPWWDEED